MSKKVVQSINNFTNGLFGDLKVITIKNEPWFIGKEIAGILGYKDTKAAIRDLVESDNKDTLKPADIKSFQRGCFTPSEIDINNRGETIINEAGLYQLIMHSKLPQAKVFQKWVYEEVLPSIRKNGYYETDTVKDIRDVKINKIKSCVGEITNITEEEKDVINGHIDSLFEYSEEDVQAISIGKEVLAAEGYINVGQIAKQLTGEGYPISRTAMMKWMRDHYYLCRDDCNWNLPKQDLVKSGVFKIGVGWPTIEGEPSQDRKVLVTPKGAAIIMHEYKSEYDRLYGYADVRDKHGFIILLEMPGSEADMGRKLYELDHENRRHVE